MEVKAKVPAEQTEVPHVVRHDRGPHLPGTQGDQKVVPEGRDLRSKVGFLLPDLAEKLCGSLPGSGVGRHDPAYPVSPPGKIEDSSPSSLIRCAREEFGGHPG